MTDLNEEVTVYELDDVRHPINGGMPGFDTLLAIASILAVVPVTAAAAIEWLRRRLT